MQPLVSICIPTYNNEQYIKATLESILEQTYENIEVVVVDDHSKDHTVEIVKSIEDERIKLYINDQNLGMVGNWNRCLELATGEFVKLICADDMIHKNAVEREVEVLTKYPNVNLVESDTQLVDINDKKAGVFKRYPKSGVVKGKKVAKCSLMLNNFFGAPVNNMFRRAVLDKTGGFDKSFTYILDFDMWVRIACQGDIYIIHEVLNSFRVRNDSNTGDMIGNQRNVYVDEHRRLVEKHAREGIVKISAFECKLSVLIRRLRNIMIGVYLKIFAK